jgi:glycosyltransferase involved in cell wall biosynthesis
MLRRIRELLVAHALAMLLPPVTFAEALLRGRLPRRATRPPRLLFIDMRLPLPWYGAGFSRANAILRLFLETGWCVACYSIIRDTQPSEVVRADIPSAVRIVKGGRITRLSRFILGRVFAYDLILVSRRPTIERVGEVLRRIKSRNADCKVIFDFEALPPLGARSREILGNAMTRAQVESVVRGQIADVSWVDAVICNSSGDAQALQRLGRLDATAVNYLDMTAPTTADVSERKHLLFVGRLAEEDSPNVDGFIWFIREVWPTIVARLGADVRLLVVGLVGAPSVLKVKAGSVEFMGVVPDLYDVYNRAKIFVAANRVSFGVPIKVLEAAAYGLPVVTTNEVNSYLGWDNGTEILCDDAADGFAEACVRLYEDPALWRELRDRALGRIDAEGNRQRLLDVVERLVPRVT